MKKLTPKFKGTVIQGRFIPEDTRYFSHLRQLENKKVSCVIKEEVQRNSRSNQQLRYYFGVIVKLLSEATGYTVDEMHEVLKLKFNSKVVIINKQEITIALSTGDLNTIEVEEYFSKCREWASIELNCYVPLPNEVDY